jgi:hypothetical protein
LTDAYAQLAGEISASGGLVQLAAVLANGGVRVTQRESSHYAGGSYLKAGVRADITIECIASGDFLVRGDAETVDLLAAAASQLSQGLATMGTRHRLEVYNPDGRLLHYLHHRWPQPSEGEPGVTEMGP